MLTDIEGEFVKIAFLDDVERVLARGMAERPAARFNRPGQDALYLSPDEISARVAIGEYAKADDAPRVLLRFRVSKCMLFDMRARAAGDVYADAKQPWRSVVATGGEPKSWVAADAIRSARLPGLIDPSRRREGLWHVTLFKWNEASAPVVEMIGKPQPIELILDQR